MRFSFKVFLSMFRHLDPKDMHTGCTRCNYTGCMWLRDKHGPVLGHFIWTAAFASRTVRDRFKGWLRSFSDLDYTRIEDVEVDDIDTRDYPDFCDAYIVSATYKGRPMTDAELDRLNEDSDFVYSQIERVLY